MNLLALDTATEACSVALVTNTGRFARWQQTARQHANALMPMIQAVLDEARMGLTDLDGLAYGRGPGSFTGLRIAAGVTQGLALSLALPAVPVSVLTALAHGAFQATAADRACAAVDARMGEVYWGVFRRDAQDLPALVGQEAVLAPEGVHEGVAGHQWVATGTGWGAHRAIMERALGTGPDWLLPTALPRAGDIAALALAGWWRGEAVGADRIQPVYLRDQITRAPGG